jgi:O-antigen/teichoic acid export membrane protein
LLRGVLLRHSSILLGTRLVALVANGGLYVCAARLQSAPVFGQLVAMAGVAAIASIPLDLGSAARATRSQAMDDASPALGSAVMLRVKQLPLVAIVPASALAVRAVLDLDFEIAPVALVCVWSWLLTVQTLIAGVLLGLGRTLSSAGLYVIDKLVALACVGLFSGHTDSVYVLAVAFLGGITVSVVAGFVGSWGSIVAAVRLVPTDSPRRRVVEQASYLANAVGVQIQNLDVAIVGWLANPTAAGILAGPSRLTGPLGVLAGSVSSVLLVQRRHLGPDRAGMPTPATISRIALATGLFTALCVSPLLIFPAQVMTLLLGSEFAASGDVARLTAVGVCMSAVSQPLAADLQAGGRYTTVGMIILSGGALGIATVMATAPEMGALGGGVGVLVTQTIVLGALVMVRRSRHQGRHRQQKRTVPPGATGEALVAAGRPLGAA